MTQNPPILAVPPPIEPAAPSHHIDRFLRSVTPFARQHAEVGERSFRAEVYGGNRISGGAEQASFYGLGHSRLLEREITRSRGRVEKSSRHQVQGQADYTSDALGYSRSRAQLHRGRIPQDPQGEEDVGGVPNWREQTNPPSSRAAPRIPSTSGNVGNGRNVLYEADDWHKHKAMGRTVTDKGGENLQRAATQARTENAQRLLQRKLRRRERAAYMRPPKSPSLPPSSAPSSPPPRAKQAKGKRRAEPEKLVGERDVGKAARITGRLSMKPGQRRFGMLGRGIASLPLRLSRPPREDPFDETEFIYGRKRPRLAPPSSALERNGSPEDPRPLPTRTSRGNPLPPPGRSISPSWPSIPSDSTTGRATAPVDSQARRAVLSQPYFPYQRDYKAVSGSDDTMDASIAGRMVHGQVVPMSYYPPPTVDHPHQPLRWTSRFPPLPVISSPRLLTRRGETMPPSPHTPQEQILRRHDQYTHTQQASSHPAALESPICLDTGGISTTSLTRIQPTRDEYQIRWPSDIQVNFTPSESQRFWQRRRPEALDYAMLASGAGPTTHGIHPTLLPARNSPFQSAQVQPSPGYWDPTNTTTGPVSQLSAPSADRRAFHDAERYPLHSSSDPFSPAHSAQQAGGHEEARRIDQQTEREVEAYGASHREWARLWGRRDEDGKGGPFFG